MKKFAVIALAAGALAPAFATDIGVSIGINQPGVYGRIDIGNAPPPVVYSQPVLINQTNYARRQPPVYLYVPSEHQRDWSRHCSQYGACGQPVYFVQEQWVHQRYQRAHPEWRDQRRHDDRRSDRRDDRHDDDRHDRSDHDRR